MRQRPLASLGAAALAAQFLAIYLPPAALWLLVAFSVLSLVVLALRHRWLGTVLAAVCFVVLGLHGLADVCWKTPCEALSGSVGEITARVIEATPTVQPGTVSAVLQIETLNGKPVKGLRAQCIGLEWCEEGDLLRGEARFTSLPQNPQVTSWWADGVFLYAELQNAQFTGRRLGLAEAASQQRASIASRLTRRLSGEVGQVAAAMTLGRRKALSGDLRSTFRMAGLSHLLVVSGLHLGIWGGVWYAAAYRLLRRRRRAACLVGMAAVCGFALLVGFTPSVQRALTASLLFFLSGITFRRPDGPTSLGAAVLFLVLSNPYAVYDNGLLLSVFATAGVLFSGFAVRRTRLYTAAEKTEAGRVCKGGARLLGAVAVPFFASLFTLPILVRMGVALPLASLPANLAAGLLLTPLLVCGWLAAGFGALLPGGLLFQAFSYGCGTFVRWLCLLATFFSRLGGVTVWGGYAQLCIAVLFVLGAIGWKTHRARRLFLIAPLCISFCFGLYGLLWRGTVSIALVGSSYNPCAVVLEEGKALVLFRGGALNARAVEEYLALHGAKISYLADLREEEEGAMPPLACDTYQPVCRTAPLGVQNRPLPHVQLALACRQEGNLALLEISGYTVAMTSGTADWSDLPPVGFWLAGPSRARLDCGRILSLYENYTWMAGERVEIVVGSSPAVWLRPGQTITEQRETP